MVRTIVTLILIVPELISCQQLPVEDLIKKGITKEEISKTISMTGENGVNDFFLVFRQKIISLQRKNRRQQTKK